MQPRPQGAFPGFGGGAARPTIFRFLFSSVDSSFVSAWQEVSGHTLSRQSNLTFGIGLHEVGARMVGVQYIIPNFLAFMGYQFILALALRHARFARELRNNELQSWMFDMFILVLSHWSENSRLSKV